MIILLACMTHDSERIAYTYILYCYISSVEITRSQRGVSDRSDCVLRARVSIHSG